MLCPVTGFMVSHASLAYAAEDKRSALWLFFYLRSSFANPFSVDLAYLYSRLVAASTYVRSNDVKDGKVLTSIARTTRSFIRYRSQFFH
jgi:hypothetical protein